ncbi:LysR family transcriptional regulator [Roseomonas sp. GC11]|uniref:LysR family transcriptional regulator n=1 Tax=Roseomonas sp. GC11 TaxID=2950546 RepID=UPI00210AAFF3|nr:LysR family transcriptional regulator [Roseomonas sp. GC11]MCQ4160365.1 LysR family transcriptional regulator [Roseomonas sp. GC11]
MPDIRDLEVFYWVARLGGFRRAAERLHTTQPAISLRIAGLEERLGVRLLERGARLTGLTPKGREFLDYAERLLRLHAEMLDAIATPESLSGIVRLGVAETIVHTWLARFIERVHATHPAITLEIEVDVSPHLSEALLASRLDLAFLLGPVSEPHMLNLPLCSYPLSFVAGPGLDLGPEPVPLHRLVRWPVITYPKTTLPYIQLRQMLMQPALAPPRIYSSSSLSTIVRMTLDGIGVSVIPAAVIGAELARGELRLVRTEVGLPDLAFTATTPLTPDSSPAQRLARLACALAAEEDDKQSLLLSI